MQALPPDSHAPANKVPDHLYSGPGRCSLPLGGSTNNGADRGPLVPLTSVAGQDRPWQWQRAVPELVSFTIQA